MREDFIIGIRGVCPHPVSGLNYHTRLKKHSHIKWEMDNPILNHHILGIKDVCIPNFR